MDDAHTLARQMRSMIVFIWLTVSGEPLCRTSWKGRQLSSELQHKPGGKWLNRIDNARTMTAATRPVSCDRPPVSDTIAVRGGLAFTGNAPMRPDMMLPAPTPTKSRSTSGGSLGSDGKDRVVAAVRFLSLTISALMRDRCWCASMIVMSGLPPIMRTRWADPPPHPLDQRALPLSFWQSVFPPPGHVSNWSTPQGTPLIGDGTRVGT
jgi:hypothetical protein